MTVQFTITLGVSALTVENDTNPGVVDKATDELVATISDVIAEFDFADAVIEFDITDTVIEFDIADIVDTVIDFDINNVFVVLDLIDKELSMCVLNDDKLLSFATEAEETVYEVERDTAANEEELAMSKVDVVIVFDISVIDG